MKTIAILDADFLIFEAQNIFKSKILNWMIFGVLLILQKFIRNLNPYTFVLVWDPERLEKQEIYPFYRKNRIDGLELDKNQFQKLLQILKNLGIKQFYKEGLEADQIIAQLVNFLKNEKNLKIIICSDDKDFFQLLSDNVEMLGRKRGLWTREKFEKIWGIEPRLFSSFQALYGDKIDNVPGIFNKEESLQIIKQKGNLENWFFNKDFSNLPKDFVDKIIQNYEQIKINWYLVNLLNETLDFDSYIEPVKNLNLVKEDFKNLKIEKLLKIFKNFEILSEIAERPLFEILKKSSVNEQILNCQYKSKNQNTIFYGNKDSEILFLGLIPPLSNLPESLAPFEIDLRFKKDFVLNPSLKILIKSFKELNLDFEDYLWGNVIPHSYNYENITEELIEDGIKHLKMALKEFDNIQVIVFLGIETFEIVSNYIDLSDYKYFVLPHPSFVARFGKYEKFLKGLEEIFL